VNVIKKFTNKLSIYEFAKSVKIPTPETKIVNDINDLREFASKFGFPIIIKPTDATNSRGFRKIKSESDIKEESIDSSRFFSKSRQVIVQNFVDGEMITLEGVCSGGKHKTIATSKKESYFKPGITTGVRYPSFLPNEMMEKIISCNDKYVESSGIKFALTHSEYIINNSEFYLIEIGARGGGAGITDKIVPWVTGINTYDILYQSLLGEKIDVKGLKPLARSALLKYYQKEDVSNCNEEKAQIIKKIPGVADFQFDFIGKQYIKDENDSRHTMAIYLAESDEQLQNALEQINKILKEN
jgi:biotin carboxylase